MRILAIRVGRVGDTIMMTPALAALLEIYPDATLTIIASPEGARLLKNYHPRVEAIWVWNRYGLQSHFHRKKLMRMVAESNFDMAFCFDNNPGIALVAKQSKGKVFLQGRLGAPTHCARHYLNTIEKATGQTISDIYDNIPVSAQASADVAVELASHGIEEDDIVIMLHPTYSGYSKLGLRKRHARRRKLWPAQNYANLAKRLIQHSTDSGPKIKLLMVLLPNELGFGHQINSMCDNMITLLPSDKGFERYLAMIKRANLFVSPDTGPMHIAAAVDTRTVSMFSDKDPADCGPFMKPGRYQILRSELTEHPERGIAAITVDAVFTACLEQLDKITHETGT